MWQKIDCVGLDGRFFCSGVIGRESSMFIFGGRNIHSFAFGDVLTVKLKHCNPRAGLRNLVGDAEFADIVFIMPDDSDEEEEDAKAMVCSNLEIPEDLKNAKRIFAHRNIICERSAAFRTMLSMSMQEGRTGVILMRETTKKIMTGLLVYLYTDVLEESVDFIGLLELANQWQLFHLKGLCEEKMIEYLSLDNAVQVCMKSYKMDCHNLYESSKQFIQKNQIVLSKEERAQIGPLIATLASPTKSRKNR
jgi:hypothetical protein